MTRESPFHRIAIVGVGLIGGSLGQALKKLSAKVHVRGIGRDAERLQRAVELGAIDEFDLSVEKALRDRDLVVLATPVEHILQMLETLGPNLDPGTVVTDVGSTKRLICRRARHHLPSGNEFIGGHPVAGREVSGVDNSLPRLFQQSPYILCPQPGIRSQNLQSMIRMVEGLGAKPTVMDAEDHDLFISWTSHLPQLISTALAGVSALEDTADHKLVRISGTGFRDMIRLAGSPYAVWKGILETNDDNIDLTLEAFIRQLEKMRSDLKEHRLSYDFDRAVEFYKTYREIKKNGWD